MPILPSSSFLQQLQCINYNKIECSQHHKQSNYSRKKHCHDKHCHDKHCHDKHFAGKTTRKYLREFRAKAKVITIPVWPFSVVLRLGNPNCPRK